MNKVILIGRVGQDPKITEGSKTTVANITIATKNYDKSTEWHNVTLFGTSAEFCKNYVSKGDMVAVEGSNKTETYTDKDGNERRSFKVLAASLECLSYSKDKKKAESKQPEKLFYNEEIPF